MCLVAISWKSHAAYPLLISANRDEFFDRPTQALHLWDSGFYAGKDLRSGGTWLGFHPNGRWALLTNYRDFISQRKAEISRGALVQNFLESDLSPDSYLKQIEKEESCYDGFNLLVSDGDSLWYYSNYGHNIQQLNPGIHILSNGLLNDPWPKALLAKQQMEALISEKFTIHDLLNILKSDQTFESAKLPSTGLSQEMEVALSAQFIRMKDNYGTVSASAVLLSNAGLVQLKERRYEWEKTNFKDQEFQFKLDKPIQTK